MILEREDLGLELRAVVDSDRAGNDWARNAASTAQSLLGRDKDVRDVLIFAQQLQ